MSEHTAENDVPHPTPWRVGRKVPRNVYDANDEPIIMAPDEGTAARIVAAMNTVFPPVDWCAQADWPVVPCLLTCKESAPHHHHGQQGTRWTNPGSVCPGTRVLPPATTNRGQS